MSPGQRSDFVALMLGNQPAFGRDMIDSNVESSLLIDLPAGSVKFSLDHFLATSLLSWVVFHRLRRVLDLLEDKAFRSLCVMPFCSL